MQCIFQATHEIGWPIQQLTTLLFTQLDCFQEVSKEKIEKPQRKPYVYKFTTSCIHGEKDYKKIIGYLVETVRNFW